MSDVQLIESAQATEVASLRIPVTDKYLLLPSVSVAEIVGFTPPKVVDNTPVWMMGIFSWRETEVPLLCWEVLTGGSQPEPDSFQRIVVLNNTGLNDDLPFIALAAQGIPHLERVTTELIEQDTSAELNAFELMAVDVAGSHAYIPNIAALEQAYLDLS